MGTVHAYEDGDLVGIYVGDGPRAASWARRANPHATIAAPNPYDICVCGDYRRDHDGGTGPCKFPPDALPGFVPCRAFRLATQSKAGASNQFSNEEGPGGPNKPVTVTS